MIPFRVVRLLMPALLVLASSLPALGQAQGQAVCRAPDAVCAAASRVFRIAGKGGGVGSVGDGEPVHGR